MPETPFQPQLEFSPHNNQSLFSDHYLQEILRRTPAWRDMQAPAAEFLTWLRDLYAGEQDQLASYNESQLEDNWFKPILTQLGHVWEGQASIPGLKGNIKKPDFALFPDEAARQTAVPHQNSDQYSKDVLALLEAKKWHVNLSKKSGTQPRFDDQNPMYQIDTYLSLSNVTWGVVSNGRFWRLVHKNSSRTLETYFEIDLLAALETPNDRSALAVATFFWAFFNQAAFRPDAHGTIFLDEALSQSKAYAIALEADLRDNAYRSLEQLIIGFFAGDGRLDPKNAGHRDEVYRNSLYLLYRLLFLFYGEARALLPMGNDTYKEAYSLQTLARDIDRQRERMESQPTTGRRHWDRLQELFRLISGRDPQFNAELGVPRYNGGLFDPDQHRFLEDHFVGDRALAQAIDYLAYRRVREDGRFQGYQAVDYRTLDVRQLGSIYEGLLEYKVAVATEEMVTVRKKGVETWVPQAKKGRSKTVGTPRQPGELYLTTDKGERKATGSYYTPDYIVEYIVENTLGPLVAQARERVKAQVRQTGSLDKEERQRQSAALFVQEILALNVLDPAMGSGHFLVEAMNFLARALATDEYASAQIGPFSQNGPISDAADETDLLYWKRRVVEACIYGVDKNPMAVELAKLSLWLKTAAADKPLSFLDHHLQHGDSLIGAWLDDLKRPPLTNPQSPISNSQSPLLNESAFTRDINRAVADVMQIERLPTLDIDDIHAKEATWQQIRDRHVARWQKLADLWVSATFGNTMTPEEYRALAAHLQGQESLLSETQINHFLQHPAVADNDYFHWELAFPEVFFDEYGRHRREAAGFDAVIGNPPYALVKDQNIRSFLDANFESCEYQYDLFVVFMEQAIKTTRHGGIHSFIVPTTFMVEYYFKKIRNYILQTSDIQKLLHFTYQVFKDVTVESAIYQLNIGENKNGENLIETSVIDQEEAFRKGNFAINKIAQKEFAKLSDTDFNITIASPVGKIALKIFNSSHYRLDEIAEITVGIKPYQTGKGKPKQTKADVKSRIYDATYKVDDTYKLYLMGRDVNRYVIAPLEARWLSYGDWLAEPRPAAPFFNDKKILIRQTGDSIIAALDSDQHLTLNNIHNLDIFAVNSVSYEFLLAILNSKLITAYHQVFVPEAGRTFAEVKTVDLVQLPIPKIKFREERQTAVVNTAKTHYKQGNTTALLAWATAELAANRSDTIHDLLAFLAEQMIALNRQKQAALEAFWLDLEGVTDPKPFDTLRHKGKWEQSLHKNVPAARPYVAESSRSTITLDATLGWNEDAFKGMVKELVGSISGLSKLVQVYRDHAPNVATLNQRLTTTDHLIDQIVYKLYNLTPEEIAIVEGEHQA